MANEVTNTISFTVSKNSVTISGGTTKQSDMTGTVLVSEIFAVSSTLEALSALVPDITTVGNIYIRNLDASATLLVCNTNASSAYAICNWIRPGDQVMLSPYPSSFANMYVQFSSTHTGHAHIACFAHSAVT